MNKPLISVIIPAHNSAATIGAAIESMAEQTYPNLEIIVINDNSADNTGAVVRQLTKKYANLFYYELPFDDPHRFNKRGRNINAGYSSRNYGFEKAAGEWITFQDADDASLLNRIEVQYTLAQKYNSNHVCIDWQKYDDNLVGKKLDVDKMLSERKEAVISKQEIQKLVQKTKGHVIPFLGPLNAVIPFEFKRLRIINKLFFGSLEPYPCAGNSPLFKREIIKKVKFRALKERIWPSFMGRGADRDFNFQVAETFRNSYAFFIPLYLWRQKSQNKRYRNRLDRFMIT